MPRYKVDLIISEIEKENYHLFVRIKIGKLGSLLMLDTGASKTVFDKHGILKFVNAKNIRTIDSRSVGLGNIDSETQVVKVKKVKVGKKRSVDLEVAILDLSHVNQSYTQLNLPNIDGVLGSDFLMKYKAIINYDKKTLSVR
jgi:hypothetical protein